MKKVRLCEEAFEVLTLLAKANGEPSVTKTLNKHILEIGHQTAGDKQNGNKHK